MSGILALGAYVPERVMTNADFEAYLDTSDEWIVTRTGIKERRVAAEDEYTSDLAFKAVEDLLRRHPGALEGVDAVIVATNTPDALFPDTAALVQARFGLKAFAYDLLAGCPGWIYALAQAHALVEAGLAQKVLAVGAEALSKIIDWNDRATAVLFGDGGGAALGGMGRAACRVRASGVGEVWVGAEAL